MTPEHIRELAARKQRRDEKRPPGAAALQAPQHYYDVELTYTSNAIEGNTLTHGETALVVKKGITIGGKTLREHIEARDHYAAVQFMRELAAANRPLAEKDMLDLHEKIVFESNPAIAGQYAITPRRVAGSATRWR